MPLYPGDPRNLNLAQLMPPRQRQNYNSDRMKAKLMKTLLVFVCVVCTTKSLDNGLGRTPQMGWNSWNHFRCSINAQLVMDTADAMVCVIV